MIVKLSEYPLNIFGVRLNYHLVYGSEKWVTTAFDRCCQKIARSALYVLYGDLTMKGVIKPVKLDVESGGIVKDPWGNEKAVINLQGKIDRKDWGLN